MAGTAFDSGPLANHATYHDDAVTAGPITGSSLASSGTGGSIERGGAAVDVVPGQDVGSTTAWAVACSFRYTGENTADYNKDIFACWHSRVFGRANFHIGLDETLHLRGFYTEAVSTTARIVINPDPIAVGRAYRAWLVRDAGTLKLYLNGELIDTAIVPEDEVAIAGAQIVMGNYFPAIDLPRMFIGQISDCMTFSGPKSAGEIAVDYFHFRPLTGSEIGVPGSDYLVTTEGHIISPDSVDTSLYPARVSLAEAITTLCKRVGLTEDDIDVSGI